MKFRHLFFNTALALGLSLGQQSSFAESATPQMEIFKSPQCGCCGKWVEHLNRNGFDGRSVNTADMASIKQQLGIPAELQSCHTGRSGNYVFEGHIPAKVIQQFLATPPADAYGLAVPGMPIGSPGMEMGDRHQDYDVMLLSRDGNHRVYSHISQTAGH